jgi:thioesterase domain-containing protein
MAETYLEALRSVQPRGPYRLAAWSMGGAVAYEMALRLTAVGEEVAALVLLDSSVSGGAVRLDDVDVLAAFAADLAGLAKKSFDLEPAALREVAPERRVPLFLEQAQAVGALPAGCGVRQLDRLLNVFRANLEALHAWDPRLSFPGEIVLARPAAKLARGDKDGGWGRLSGLEVRIWPLQGDHYSLLREPEASGLAHQLGRFLDEISRR